MSGNHSIERKTFVAPDSTRIRYQDAGEGPPIVLANGLGGNFNAWTYVARFLLEDGFRVLSWDYRGLYESDTPKNGRIALTDQVDDLVGILDAEGIDRALLFGWSMGCQVIYEFAVRCPARVAGLIPICGAAGSPFDTVLNLKASRYAMPVLFRFMSAAHPLFSLMFKGIAASPELVRALKYTRLFWRSGEEVVLGFLPEFASLDFEVYGRLMMELARHDIRPALTLLRCPVLIVAADGDVFTPLSAARETNALIPDSRLAILEGASHFAPLEQPERIHRLVDAFLRDSIEPPWGRPRKDAAEKNETRGRVTRGRKKSVRSGGSAQ